MRLRNCDVVPCLSNGIGSEFKLPLGSGHGSEAAEAAHCCWGCGLLGEKHGDDRTGLGSGAPLPGLRILDVEHHGARQLLRGDVEGSGCRYSGRAKEMCSPQLPPRILCSLLKRTEQGFAPWSLLASLIAQCQSCKLFSLCRYCRQLFSTPLPWNPETTAFDSTSFPFLILTHTSLSKNSQPSGKLRLSWSLQRSIKRPEGFSPSLRLFSILRFLRSSRN